MAKKETVKKEIVKKDELREEKMKALENALTQLNKTYGKGSVMKFSDKVADTNLQVISTGCLDLDMALGVGGLPRGRVVEIYGPESSGKTTVALHCVAEAQKAGGVAAFIDAEHALDPVYAKKLGVNIDDLYISQPDTGEQALEICEALVRSGAVDIVVIDSVAALVPKAEIEGDMGDSFVGLQARLMSQALRKLTGVISKTNAVAIFINQLREKVGVMYGNPETTTGGRALKFYASVRLDVRRGEQIKNGSEVIGNRTKVKVVKNKVAPPFKVAEFDIIYGEGISKFGSLLDMAVERDIIHKSGAWFSYEDQRIGQGRENARQYLRDHPELADRIEKIVREEAMAAASNNAAEPQVAAASEEEDPDLALMDEIEEEPHHGSGPRNAGCVRGLEVWLRPSTIVKGGRVHSCQTLPENRGNTPRCLWPGWVHGCSTHWPRPWEDWRWMPPVPYFRLHGCVWPSGFERAGAGRSAPVRR